MQLKYDQTDLKLLRGSFNKPLETNEICIQNDYYGQAEVLKKYTGWKRPLKLVYEHSLQYHTLIAEVDSKNSFPLAFVSSEYRKEVYKKQKIKFATINISSIMNYVICMEYPSIINKGFFTDSTRNGSVFFPPHSTHHIKSNVNHENTISFLDGLPDFYKPISVCMYWKDIVDGEDELYTKAGYTVVTAGHIYDKLFYFRLFDILKNFKYTIGIEVGSYMFHAARCGCKMVFPDNPTKISANYDYSTNHFKDPQLDERLNQGEIRNERIKSLFKDDSLSYNDDQIQLLEKYCSTKFLSKKRLILIFIVSEVIWFFIRVKIKISRIFNAGIKKISNAQFLYSF